MVEMPAHAARPVNSLKRNFDYHNTGIVVDTMIDNIVDEARANVAVCTTEGRIDIQKLKYQHQLESLSPYHAFRANLS